MSSEQQIPTASLSPQTLYAGMVPCEGPKVLPVLINFALGTTVNLDLTQIQMQGFVAAIQSVYVDNSQNGSSVSFFMARTQQTVTIPAYSQGYIPLLQPNPPILVITSSSTVTIYIQLLNMWFPPIVWTIGAGGAGASFKFDSSGNLLVSDQALDGCIANNKVAVLTNVYPLAMTDDGSTITSGGTAQVAIASNASRKRFIIANPDTASETLYFMYGASTASRISLTPGMAWDENGEGVSRTTIYVFAATTGHAFTAYEGT